MLFVNVYRPDADRTDFILSCEHATTNLTLDGKREDDAAEVLTNLIETHRTNAIRGSEERRVSDPTEEPVACLCVPRNWRRESELIALPN